MDEKQRDVIALNEFDKVFHSARYFLTYQLNAFSYFVVISGGGLVLISSSISASYYASLFSLLLLTASVAFYIYNRRVEMHVIEYYKLLYKLERELGMTNLLNVQEALKVRFIGTTDIIRMFYFISIVIWLGLFIYHFARWLKMF